MRRNRFGVRRGHGRAWRSCWWQPRLGAATASLAVHAQGTGPVTIARLQYGGGGDWYANPSSLPNLLAELRERAGIRHRRGARSPSGPPTPRSATTPSST